MREIAIKSTRKLEKQKIVKLFRTLLINESCLREVLFLADIYLYL